ncbi:MAG: radical SAM protein [Candidatus Paceibacterota bacterium]
MFHFQWHITERCNLRCTHCYEEKKFIEKELKTSQVFEILNKYYKQLKDWGLDRTQNRISFTGGEPFIREDFWQILENCYNHQEKVTYGILSNGTLITEETVSKLKDLNVAYVQISLEGLEEVNDEIRGRGSFKKAVSALRLLTKGHISNSISMTITNKNLKEVPKVIKLAREIGVGGLSARRLVPIGMGKQMEKLMIEPQDVKEFFKYMQNESKKEGLHVGVGCEEGLLAQENHLPKNTCNAGYYSFSVLPNADVYPCRRLPIYSGNLLENDFDEIMKNSRELIKLRDFNQINKDCQSCPYFNECMGGAKCIASAYFKDPFAPDPQCWRLFKKLPDPKQKFKKYEKKESRGFKYL